MRTINIIRVKTRLSRLVDGAAAGEEFSPNRAGQLSGRIRSPARHPIAIPAYWPAGCTYPRMSRPRRRSCLGFRRQLTRFFDTPAATQRRCRYRITASQAANPACISRGPAIKPGWTSAMRGPRPIGMRNGAPCTSGHWPSKRTAAVATCIVRGRTEVGHGPAAGRTEDRHQGGADIP